MLQFRNGPFIRPHPIFWRMIMALNVVYLLILVVVLFQTKHDVRIYLKYIDDRLGVPLPEKSYAENCSLEPSNIWSQVDEFVLAHSLGWFAKSLVLRDYSFLWILSILFELMEYSLEHQLANFAECWWDHWILDVLTANWLGIYLGMKACEYFEVKRYSWQGLRQIKGYRGKMRRSLAQFTPHSWTKFEWGPTKRFSRFLAVLALLYLVLCDSLEETQLELNVFYLKYLLWIPPSHWIIITRLFIVFFMCMPATREAYQYLTDKNCKRFGMHAWLVTFTILTELLICIKFGKDEFKAPTPPWVWRFWLLLAAGLFGYSVWQFWLKRTLRRINSKDTGTVSESDYKTEESDVDFEETPSPKKRILGSPKKRD